MSEKSHVSMEANICPICGKQHETGSLLLDTRLRQSMERVTVTGESLCKDCSAQAAKGFIALIEIDPAKSGSPNHNQRVSSEHAYRTGNVAWLRKSVAEQVFEGNLMPDADRPFVFVEPGLIQMLEKQVALGGWVQE